MKVNPHLLIDSNENTYSLDERPLSDNINVDLPRDLSPKVNPRQIKNASYCLNQLWKRLILWPLSFNENPNTPISRILEKEAGSLISGSVKSALSEILELPMSSKKLSKASEESITIFHEDYPYDFILEYKGERLGMMMLDKCIDANGQEKLIYRFNSQIKSFRGLF